MNESEIPWLPVSESQKDRRSLTSGCIGLAPWSPAVVPGRSDDVTTSPQGCVFHGSFVSCQHSTHRATWVSPEGTAFPLSEGPPCRFPVGSPLPLQQISCRSISSSICFGEVLISPENLVCFQFCLNPEKGRLGRLSLFTLLARNLRVKSEPCCCCHVCVWGQAVVCPFSWALGSMYILLHVI